MDDKQAIRCLKEGDIGGLESLVVRYQEKAVLTAFLITHDEQMAEDVVQETFLQIYRQIHRFDDQRPFEPYLMRSIVNAAINTIEKNSKWLPLDDAQKMEGLKEMIVQAGKTEDQVEYNQLKNEIYEALVRLSPRQRTVIVQRYYLDMSEKEMAKTLSVAPGTVKWLLNSARQRLFSLLNPDRRTL